MSFAGLNIAHNYSFYAIPAAWGLAIAPHFYAIALFNKERAPGVEEWDICNPKVNHERVKDAKLSPYMAGRFLRAEAAQNNGFITLPFFAAAIVAGHVARLNAKTLNTAAGVYLLSRIVFNYLYINNTTTLLGKLRTVSYLTGIGAACTLFVQAGNRFFTGYVGL
ncbi:hypothetical protein DB88DRAFT_263082 [Papiliotrema laurentii]|uniref:Uncharacterized protein n=1 Tax=Papiliotrema laurentii TaxID=5418 RepID=A0AAD9FQ58_PAPLA|nr:hypothetical protein DB88DRAFT_263082 [Papiliotrema laurentii]